MLESRVKHIIKNNLGSAINILEAGCCNGSDTIEFCNLFTNGKIYGFEADPRMYEELEEIEKKCSNFKLNKYALANTCNTEQFYIGSINGAKFGSSSALNPFTDVHKSIHPDIRYEKIFVPYITIDAWADLNNVKSIEFMWLDLQGVEPIVLENCQILDSTIAVFSEVSLQAVYEGTILYTEYKKMMESKGFFVAIEDLPHVDMGNVLFIRKGHKIHGIF